MNRQQQLSLVIVLGLISSIPAFAASPSEQGGGWRTTSEETASSTLSGKLYRNSADQNGSLPYIVLDRWGVVRGYVGTTQGVELESCVGQQVSLQGTIKTMPGGDMPCMTCTRVLNGNAEMTGSGFQHRPASVGRSTSAVAAQVQPQELTTPADLPTRGDMARDPTPQTTALPLREVVLEPRSIQAADDSDNHRNAPSVRRVDPRRSRRAGVQSTNYQETVPTPAPLGQGHKSPSPLAADPGLEPSPMDEGAMVSEGPMVDHGRIGCDTCNDASCNPCNGESYMDNSCWGPRRPLFCVGPTGIWARADYLLWWERGTHVPALVSTAPLTTTAPYTGQNAGYLDDPASQVLFGNQDINNKSESGGRIQAGVWLDSCATIGFEGEYFALADETTDYYLWSDGNPIISRPFFDTGHTVTTDVNGVPTTVVSPVENVERVAFPRGSTRSYDGSIDIHALTRFHGAGAHFLFTTCRQEGSWTDDCGYCATVHDRFRSDIVAGYRYLNLEDQIGITEAITSTSPPPVTTDNPNALSAFLVQDHFNTQNSFNGGDIGMKFEFQRNRWSLDLFPRVALGSTHSSVDINGSTRVTNGVVATGAVPVETTYSGGLLAQSTNIGHYSQDNFAYVPQLDLNLGFQMTRHTRLILGYSGMYWSKVARAGEQIDRVVNSTLIPPGGNPVGDVTHPQFNFQYSGFWAQGINAGVDCRW